MGSKALYSRLEDFRFDFRARFRFIIWYSFLRRSIQNLSTHDVTGVIKASIPCITSPITGIRQW